MVTDQQVRRLMALTSKAKTLAAAAAKAGMDEKTARKYRRLGTLPTAVTVAHVTGHPNAATTEHLKSGHLG